MRKAIAIAAGLLVLAVVNWSIYARERLLETGQVVLLELAPVDPRSLMQGDYMALRFKLAGELSSSGRPAQDGFAVVRPGEHGVAGFVRRDNGETLAPGDLRLRYRIREGTVKFATNAYFFEEGSGNAYTRARFGAFRVSTQGEMLLTHLVNEKFERMGPAGRKP